MNKREKRIRLMNTLEREDTTKYNEVCQELYGCDYNSVGMDTLLRKVRVQRVYTERQGCMINPPSGNN
jgi:hypothetical protein